MARTDTWSNYLTDVADAIREKSGTSEPIVASSFDTAILNIPSGGETPVSISELTQNLSDLINDFNAYCATLSNSYNTGTTENLTLYTPNIDFKYYLIQKTTNNKYRVVWFITPCVTLAANNIYEAGAQITLTVEDLSKTKFIKQTIVNISIATSTYFQNATAPYCSQECDTLEDCIEKLTNNELTYSRQYQKFGYQTDTPNIFPYTNMAISYSDSSDYQYFVTSLLRLSSNETIVATE